MTLFADYFAFTLFIIMIRCRLSRHCCSAAPPLLRRRRQRRYYAAMRHAAAAAAAHALYAAPRFAAPRFPAAAAAAAAQIFDAAVASRRDAHDVCAPPTVMPPCRLLRERHAVFDAALFRAADAEPPPRHADDALPIMLARFCHAAMPRRYFAADGAMLLRATAPHGAQCAARRCARARRACFDAAATRAARRAIEFYAACATLFTPLRHFRFFFATPFHFHFAYAIDADAALIFRRLLILLHFRHFSSLIFFACISLARLRFHF